MLPSNSVPNSAGMEFNWLTFNGVSAPVNHADDRAPRQPRSPPHRKSRHGSSSDPSAWQSVRANRHRRRPRSRIHLVSANTVLVGVAQARVVEFDAKYPGAWMVHCHLPHHMMNT